MNPYASSLQATTDKTRLVDLIPTWPGCEVRANMAAYRKTDIYQARKRLSEYADHRQWSRQYDRLRYPYGRTPPELSPDATLREAQVYEDRNRADVYLHLRHLGLNPNDAHRVLYDPSASDDDRIEAGRALVASGFGRHAAAQALRINIDGKVGASCR